MTHSFEMGISTWLLHAMLRRFGNQKFTRKDIEEAAKDSLQAVVRDTSDGLSLELMDCHAWDLEADADRRKN